MPVARKDEERSSELRSSVSTLDLSERGLRIIEPLPDGISPQTLLYNHNNISRIENLQYFAHLQQLSLAANHLVEMKGISQAQGLKVLDLSNNSIITIEGLTHLRSLEWLNLSGNSIKRMQNLEKNINLYHLDLSDNSIVKICNLRNLTKLKTLLLHGNLVSSLKNITDNVHESSLVTLSLAENEISDLNEITSLKVLTSLEQLSIAGNQCLLALSNVIGFNYRPFILFNCQRLHNLDAHLISQADRLECEKLRSEGQLRTFSPGRHLQLVKYLTQATPLRQSKTPTPTIDSISSSTQAERWSEPVLDDKPSTEARDLDVEDVTESEFLDDQLVSESCYLPITVSSIMSAHGDPSSDNLEDWYTANAYRTSEAVAHSNQDEIYHKRDVIPEERNVGIPVDSIPDEEKNGIQQPVVPGNEEEVGTPLMTEEEALNLIHLAATIIQAHVRGFLVRRTLHFYEYRHKKQAATLIQAVWRGYRTRAYNIKVITARNEIRARRLTTHVNHLTSLVVQCQEQASRDKRTMAKAIKCLWNELEKQNSRYVTWLQNQQNRAALKIQRFWKGYKVRKLYPRTKSTSVTSCQSLVVICQSLQKQIDLLKDQMEELKSEKSNRDDKSCAEEQTDSSNAEDKSSRSIPAIRITRPSVCILPELQLDASTKEHLKKRESILDDVDVEIEPLDIGEYEGSDQDVCNTTFDVETSAFETTTNEQETNAVRELENDVKDTDDFTESFDAYSKDIAVASLPAQDNVQENIDAQKEECIEDFKSLSLDDNGTCSKCSETKPDKPKEPDPTPSKEALVENESELEPTSSYESNEDLASTVKKVEINVASDGLVDKCVETTKEHKNVSEESRDGDYVTPSCNDIFDKSNADNNASVTNDDRVTLEREVTRSPDDQSEKSNSNFKQTLEREVTGSADDQSEKNDSISKQKSEEHTDFSETTSPSIQADVSMSSDTSVSDSSASPSKLDTSSGRKKKKLLLRSTSAETSPRLRTLHSSPSLDAQQLSSSLNFDSRLSQRSASLLRELRTEIASLTVRQLSDTDYFENQNTTEKSAHSTGNLTGSQTNHPTSDTFGCSPRVPRDDRDYDKRHGTLIRDDPIGGISDKITTTLSGQEVEQRGQEVKQGGQESETTPDGEENAVEDHTKADESSQPSTRQTSFTLPAFEDVEASLSMEDFMNDSLEGQCDD